MDEKIAITSEFRLRLTELEYQKLPEDELKKQIEYIYIEEYGKELNADMDIFYSSQSKNLADDSSGYDGTAIHFYSKEDNINEVYLISQGTQDMTDWNYNIEAMLAGKDYGQALATKIFAEEINEVFGINSNKEDTAKMIGLSHSLAHNNNTTAHLAYGIFDEIYSVNGAQTNYYQLFIAHKDFREKVEKHFNISRINPDAIYDLDPKKLEMFALDYYAEKAENIHQLISKDDPLYAVSGIRGFFTLGEVKMYDTNPDLPGLRAIMDDLPDNVVKDIQELAIQYTVSSQEGGTEAAVQDILGVDMGIIKEIDGFGSVVKIYATKQGEIDTVVRNLNDNLPDLMRQVKQITSNADAIFSRFEDAGYITKTQKKEIVTVMTNIQQELEGIQESVSLLVSFRDGGDLSAQIGADVGAFFKIKKHIDVLMKNIEVLGKDEYKEILEAIGASHGIAEMLSAISNGEKSYLGVDMLMTGSSDGIDIKVNISASLRMYQEGKMILEEKLSEITRMKHTIERELFDCFTDEKMKVINKINDIEQNPGMYQNLLRKHVYFSRLDKRVRRIEVYETFYPLKDVDMEYELVSLNKSVERGFNYLEKYRKAIENLFDKDDHIATLFDLSGRL